jgi:hypothetical protein
MSANENQPILQLPPGGHGETTLKVNGRNSASLWGEAIVHGRVVAELVWSPEGTLIREKPFAADGQASGLEVEYDESGRVRWLAHWVAGEMHGTAMQLDANGLPLVVTEFVHGLGIDVWMSCGDVSEVRTTFNGIPDGLVRWGDPTRPDEEEHFVRGKRHGIFRSWQRDKMRAGYPMFYVDDLEVTREAYLAACAADCTLPPYDESDDANDRSMPPGVRDGVERAQQLRSGFSLDSYLQQERATLTPPPTVGARAGR